jgi:hypothetical protein
MAAAVDAQLQSFDAAATQHGASTNSGATPDESAEAAVPPVATAAAAAAAATAAAGPTQMTNRQVELAQEIATYMHASHSATGEAKTEVRAPSHDAAVRCARRSAASVP